LVIWIEGRDLEDDFVRDDGAEATDFGIEYPMNPLRYVPISERHLPGIAACCPAETEEANRRDNERYFGRR